MYSVFIKNATIFILKTYGNVLLNGFASEISANDKIHQVGIKLAHFKLKNEWSIEEYEIIDKTMQESYCKDNLSTVRLKCTALFLATWIVQPIGLTLNTINRVAKIVTFAQLWNPSKRKV